MSKAATRQLNIRSDVARERVVELTRRTGKSVTQVVEDALNAYDPQPDPQRIGRLVRKGRLLVMPASGRLKLSVEDVQRSIDEAREERMDDIWGC